MALILATKTLDKIEQVIHADQGASYRGFLKQVMPHIGDAYRSEKETFRSHMGASALGRKCGREIWYSFHWATVGNHTGRMMRLFNRGHMEEGRFIAMLLCIGVKVYQQDANGKQYAISGSAGHYGGSGDGVGVGIPDLPPGLPALLEFKTHSKASFDKLVKEGVRASKFEHFVQVQQYMRKMGLTATLYVAVNKNDDTLYAEIILLEAETADTFIARADKIVWMHRAPEKIGKPPSIGNYDCKFCDHKAMCFTKQKPPVNCRTCEYSRPTDTGHAVWVCTAQNNLPLTKEMQLVGCTNWHRHPDIGG